MRTLPLFLVLAALACGTSDAGPDAEDVGPGQPDACGAATAGSWDSARPAKDERCGEIVFSHGGGDLAGTWNVAYACGDFTVTVGNLWGYDDFDSPFECDFLDVERAVEAEGTVTYVDLQETLDLRWRMRTQVDVPEDCLAELDPGKAPADVCASLGERAAPGVTDACRMTGGDCACDFTQSVAELGTFAIDPPDGDEVTRPGCDAHDFLYEIEDGVLEVKRWGLFVYFVR
jgi:hypothetical protein